MSAPWFLLLATVGTCGAEPSPALRPGAVELGVAGSLTRIESVTHATVAVRCGNFIGAGTGLAGGEAELSYAHVGGLDQVGFEGNVSWQAAVGSGALYPYIAIAGGLRQEFIGSFSAARYPVGATLGLRTLLGNRAATRIEYRFRRVLGDPVADFNEHELRFGLSVLFRNRAPTGF